MLETSYVRNKSDNTREKAFSLRNFENRFFLIGNTYGSGSMVVL